MLTKFWSWYEKYYKLNVIVSAVLFALQLVHLYWLTTDVVFKRLFDIGLFPHTSDLAHILLILVDYTEIPAIISTSLVYIHLFRKNKRFKNILYLLLLNIQFIHIAWITDEYVINIFTNHKPYGWNPAIAWIAISIDYLELPVIYETIKEAMRAYIPKLFKKQSK